METIREKINLEMKDVAVVKAKVFILVKTLEKIIHFSQQGKTLIPKRSDFSSDSVKMIRVEVLYIFT